MLFSLRMHYILPPSTRERPITVSLVNRVDKHRTTSVIRNILHETCRHPLLNIIRLLPIHSLTFKHDLQVQVPSLHSVHPTLSLTRMCLLMLSITRVRHLLILIPIH